MFVAASTECFESLPLARALELLADLEYTSVEVAIPLGDPAYVQLAALDRRTLQHMGDQTLAMAASLASATPRPGGDRIFMDLAGRTLITLSLAVGGPACLWAWRRLGRPPAGGA